MSHAKAVKRFKEPHPITEKDKETRSSHARLLADMKQGGGESLHAESWFRTKWGCEYQDVLEPLHAQQSR